MDKMMLAGGMEDLKAPSKSVVVKPYQLEEYKIGDKIGHKPDSKGIRESGHSKLLTNSILEKINEEEDG